jgi:hypothetical protein
MIYQVMRLWRWKRDQVMCDVDEVVALESAFNAHLWNAAV